LLKGLRSASQSHLGQVLNIDLDSLARDSHGIALRLLTRPRAALLNHALTLQNPVDPVDTDADTFLSQVIGQASGAVTGLAPQRYDPLHHRPRHSPGMAVGTSRAVLEGMEVPTCILIAPEPLVEGLAADAVVAAHLADR